MLHWLLTTALAAAALGSAALAIRASEREQRRRVYVFKPLATLLILGVAAGGREAGEAYRWLVVAGLAFSLAGDVFLMLPRDRFVAGLASFLVAHLLYTGAFVTDGFVVTAWVLLAFVAYTGMLLALLLPRAGKLRLPVTVYAAALTLMAWQAAEHALHGAPGALLAATGATLFVLSDSALAVDRFLGRLRHAHVLVLGTYFPAQLLIALSTHFGA